MDLVSDVNTNHLSAPPTVLVKQYWHRRIGTPIGAVDVVASDRAIVVVQWEKHRVDFMAALPVKKGNRNSVLDACEIQLGEYFSGQRKEFSLPVESRGSDFQKQVWRELQKISWGTTLTYGAQAARLGKPQAVRAVGTANGRNPVSIIVPCHRVIGASGSLIGYAGGIEIKRQLLELEGVLLS